MEVVMGSSMGAAAAAVVLGVPMNIVQGIAGIIVGVVLLPVLSHASAEMGEKIRAHDKWIGKTVPETEPFFYANFDLLSCDSLWNGWGDLTPLFLLELHQSTSMI